MLNINNPMVNQGTKFQTFFRLLTFPPPIGSHVEIGTYIFHVDPPFINF
jgi:hypothetical protein